MTAPPVGTTPTHLVVGAPRHGVVTFALALADSLAGHVGGPVPTVRVEHWSDLDAALSALPRAAGVHLSFTDRLFGPTPSAAADRVVALVRTVASAGGRVTVTLHDVPQSADGGNWRARVEAYRRVCDAVHGRVTNSEHERSLLTENLVADAEDVFVIPLPLRLGDAPARPPGGEPRTVAVLGFLYPGKGHAEVLAAMAGLPADVGFTAIGECSDGHADLADELMRSADAAGRRFSLTGYVPEQSLSAVLHSISVPVAHHRHVSASGSLNTWIAAHRRPLAPANRYTLEHDARHPGTVRPYPDTDRGLADAIEAALADPDSTWLTADAAARSDTARPYARVLAQWHG